MSDAVEFRELELSLLDLHASVARLIRVIGENAPHLEHSGEVLDKLPLLDFYNDDLMRNIRLITPRDDDAGAGIPAL